MTTASFDDLPRAANQQTQPQRLPIKSGRIGTLIPFAVRSQPVSLG